jgi:Terminase RNaseH-like domain/Terminase large subunit, T4likevirus-type, N-terminal
LSRFCITATWDDVPHLSAEMKREMWDAYPAHEREARANGVPMLGSGRVFPLSEDDIKISAFPIPAHWPLIGGMDFGYDHPFAATKLAWDKDSDTIYVTEAYRKREATPVIHAAAIKPWGANLPWAWPHDGLQHDKGSGNALAGQYESQGLKTLPERATFEDGGNGVEAGVNEMLDRMLTGRWKVFAHLNDWFDEFRMYHRKDGRIVKLVDDLLSSSRYAMMMKRFAQPSKRPSIGMIGTTSQFSRR